MAFIWISILFFIRFWVPSNGMGMNDYRALTMDDIESLYTVLVNKIEQEARRADRYDEVGEFLAAAWVRLGFHDCCGSCDGCVNLNHENNGGLSVALQFLDDLYSDPRYRYNEIMSRADFIAIVATLSLRRAAENQDRSRNSNAYIPHFEYFYGRIDCGTESTYSRINDVPGGILDHNGMTDFFKREFNFNDREMVAILGAHTLGRAKYANSRFMGLWVQTGKAVLNNQYFIDLSDRALRWSQVEVGNTNFQWVHGDSLENGDQQGLMMPADMALFKNIRIIDEKGQSGCTYNSCPDAPTASIVREYARNNELFLDEFALAWNKLIQHGYEGMDCLIPITDNSPEQGDPYEATCGVVSKLDPPNSPNPPQVN